MMIFKSSLFIIIIVYAGVYDYKKRIIPDKVHLIIIVLALLSNFNIIQSLLGSIGFFLGFTKGVLAIIIALLISTIFSLILKKQSKELVALAPYLAIGSIIILLL